VSATYTKNQRAVLSAIEAEGIVSLPRLAAMVDRPKQGVAETAASLVRRGRVVRLFDSSGHVRYAKPEKLEHRA
jgi:predicted transcriptional regulator